MCALSSLRFAVSMASHTRMLSRSSDKSGETRHSTWSAAGRGIDAHGIRFRVTIWAAPADHGCGIRRRPRWAAIGRADGVGPGVGVQLFPQLRGHDSSMGAFPYYANVLASSATAGRVFVSCLWSTETPAEWRYFPELIGI